MAGWILVPCLVRLRAEFNALAPARDHASDGSIADALHSSSSDHTPDEISDALRGRDADGVNEVHAVDIDADLRTPGLSMEQVVQHLLGRCRSGAERRLRYIIFNRRIWTSGNDWRQQTYTGPNAHDKHAHFSATYVTQLEASQASWHLEELDMALDNADKTDIRAIMREELQAFGARDPLATVYNRTGYLANNAMPAALNQLTVIAGKDMVNEADIAATVLAGLSPQALGAAFTAAGFTPEALAAMVPQEMAESVVEKLHDRLAA